MTVAILSAALALLGQQSDTKQVDLAQIGLSFTCPKTWEVTTNKKAEVHIVLPVPDTQDKAELDIFPVNFDSDSDTWQHMQEVFAKNFKRELVRQWQEELLSVPLLLTRTNYTEKGKLEASVTGLLYSSDPRKLMYRLVASPDDFDKADYAWRSTMQSMRTYSGHALSPQVPGTDTKKDPKNGKGPDILPDKPPQHVIFDGSHNGTRPVKKADKSLEVTVANRKVQFRYPSSWTVSQDASGAIQLKSPGVSTPVTVGVFSTLDSDAPQRALFKSSSATLDTFAKVDHREEAPASNNLAGATVWTIWRAGTAASGALYTCDAAVSLGDFYVLAGYRCTDSSRSQAEHKLIATLLDEISVESPGS